MPLRLAESIFKIETGGIPSLPLRSIRVVFKTMLNFLPIFVCFSDFGFYFVFL